MRSEKMMIVTSIAAGVALFAGVILFCDATPILRVVASVAAIGCGAFAAFFWGE